MRAITLNDGAYRFNDHTLASPSDTQVTIRVAYAGVNRADLLQKEGKYPLPESGIPGMEVSGEISAVGKTVKDFKIGDRVCALISEGGYAEAVNAEASLTLPLSPAVSFAQAACLPEACFTALISLVWQGRVQPGEVALIHGGASGIGIIAIQLAKLLGARVFATGSTPEKCAAITKAGAEAIAYKEQDFVAVIKAATKGKGADVVIDMVGGDYFARNLDAMAQGGRLSMIAFLKGAKMDVNLVPILLKHLSVNGSTLRSRPLQEKAKIAQELRHVIWPAAMKGKIAPVIDQTFPLQEAEKALNRMHQGLNIGKILLECSPST